MEKENSDDAFGGIVSVKKLIGIAEEYRTVSEFICDVMMNDESVELNNADKSNKIHASKGLEFLSDSDERL